MSFFEGLLEYAQEHKFVVFCQLSILVVLGIYGVTSLRPAYAAQHAHRTATAPSSSKAAPSIMSGFAPKTDVQLDPPKDDVISLDELAKCDGKTEGKPIYVAIKGTVFDVSAKKDMYGPGAGYNIFAGKDASRGLGKSSLNPEDAVSDYSTLNADEMKVLDDWYTYFSKRYNVMGKVAQQ